jgi:hypothetical protein
MGLSLASSPPYPTLLVTVPMCCVVCRALPLESVRLVCVGFSSDDGDRLFPGSHPMMRTGECSLVGVVFSSDDEDRRCCLSAWTHPLVLFDSSFFSSGSLLLRQSLLLCDATVCSVTCPLLSLPPADLCSAASPSNFFCLTKLSLLPTISFTFSSQLATAATHNFPKSSKSRPSCAAMLPEFPWSGLRAPCHKELTHLSIVCCDVLCVRMYHLDPIPFLGRWISTFSGILLIRILSVLDLL